MTGELHEGCRALQLYYIQRGGMAQAGAREFGYAADRLDSADAGNHLALGRLRSAEAWFRFLLGDLEGSEAAAREGLSLLVPLEPTDAASDEHDAPGTRGVRRARSHEPIVRAVGSARNTLGNVAKRRGDLGMAEEHFVAAMALARRWGNQPQVAIFTNNLAILKKDRGDYGDAERLYRDALALNRWLGNDRSVVRNLTNLGAALVMAGDWQRAEATVAEGRNLAEEIGYGDIVPHIILNLGGAAHVAGRYALAERMYWEALASQETSANPSFEAGARSALGRTAVARGDWSAARDAFRQALETARRHDDRQHVREALIGICELYVAVGEPCRAAAILGRMPRRADRLSPQDAERLSRVGAAADAAECSREPGSAPTGPRDIQGERAPIEDAVAESVAEAVAEALRQIAAP